MPLVNAVGNSLDGKTGDGKFVGQDTPTINNAKLKDPVFLNPDNTTTAFAAICKTGSYNDLINKPIFATVATTGSYTDLSNKPTIPAAQIQSDWAQTNNSSVDFIKNKPVATYSTPTFTSSTTASILSTTRDSQVIYTYPISITTLLATQSLTAILRYADDAAISVNVVTVCDDVVGASGILNLALSGKLQVLGRIPANKYRKVTFSQVGGATIPTTLSSGQEVII